MGRRAGHSPPRRCCTSGSGRSGVGGGSSTAGTTAGGRPGGSPRLHALPGDPVRWSLAWGEDWAAPGGSSISRLRWGVPPSPWALGTVRGRWAGEALVPAERAEQTNLKRLAAKGKDGFRLRNSARTRALGIMTDAFRLLFSGKEAERVGRAGFSAQPGPAPLSPLSPTLQGSWKTSRILSSHTLGNEVPQAGPKQMRT